MSAIFDEFADNGQTDELEKLLNEIHNSESCEMPEKKEKIKTEKKGRYTTKHKGSTQIWRKAFGEKSSE